MFEASLPSTFTSLADQIALHGCFRPHETALIEGDRSHDWTSYDAAGNRIGRSLIVAGIQKGDRVAMLVSNSIWTHELMLGIWRAGAVVVPLSPMLTADILAGMLSDAGAGLLFASESYAELARAATAKNDSRLILEGESFDLFTEGQADTPCGIHSSPDDLSVIVYSSGTTGTPKGIAHNHYARSSSAIQLAAELRFHYHSVALSVIPPHSNGAWLSWLPAVQMGATTVILPKFTSDTFIAVVRKYRPTHGFIVPAMCTVLLEHPEIESAGLECFEAAITGGAPMPEAIKQEMRRLTGDGLYELWGLTEGVATIICPQDMATRTQSVGRPVLGCDIRLIDGQDRDISFKGVGEIVGRTSFGMMSGYWNRPDANAEVVWKDAQGKVYIRTGDIGEFDTDGFLTLLGRSKDMIISGGINLFPVDIESVLLTHDGVHDVTVFGVEHEKWGETPIALVILTEGARINAEELQYWANQRLAKHQRLQDLVLRSEDFPRNALGKVLKNELLENYINNAQ